MSRHFNISCIIGFNVDYIDLSEEIVLYPYFPYSLDTFYFYKSHKWIYKNTKQLSVYLKKMVYTILFITRFYHNSC